ncbi:MAG TPA: AAA family ATPase, partial [Gemmatimonadales bacterium]|nr:AAA family ATPase [Gemmatimonadales bacterium]
MFLKELQIAGFKSFAHPMRLELGPGVTAVVGPNGSGKSNIVDAVRWVLGEQSVRALRGAKGEDVIFGGSAARHALGMAEVSLVLDNSDGRIPLDVAEVAIARRLYRSGETDYLLNRRRVRLRDVLDVAGHAGLGPDSYCVVGQGAIEQLAMQRPQERRGLIADAADIRRHEARLAEIESDLTQTQQNALRVAAVVAEVKPQLDRLRAQAERAERHRAVREEVEAVARAWYGRAIPTARERLGAAERQRLKLQADIAQARIRLAAAERGRSQLHQTGAALRAQADALATALGPAREQREACRVERATAAERSQALVARAHEVTADLDATAQLVVGAEATLAADNAAVAAATAADQEPPATPSDAGILAEVDAGLAAVRQQHREAQLQVEDARRELEAAERQAARLEAAHEAAQAAEAGRAVRRAESEARLADLEAKIAQMEQELAAKRMAVQATTEKLSTVRSAHEDLKAALRESEAAANVATRTLDGLLGEERVLARLAAESPKPPALVGTSTPPRSLTATSALSR